MKILYGTRKGEKDAFEELITEDEANIKRAILWATKNGFDRFRIAEVDLNTPPDFIRTIED